MTSYFTHFHCFDEYLHQTYDMLSNNFMCDVLHKSILLLVLNIKKFKEQVSHSENLYFCFAFQHFLNRPVIVPTFIVVFILNSTKDEHENAFVLRVHNTFDILIKHINSSKCKAL